MRYISLLLALIIYTTSVFPQSAPPSIKGQGDATSLLPKPNLQVPNYQATNVGGLDALIETGNKNILVNPSFEHATVTTGWTNSAGTPTADLVNEIDGLKALSIALSAQTLNLTQDSTLFASQFNGVVQGLATVRVKTAVAGVRLCARQAGVTSSTLCATHSGSGNWELLKVPFILSATSNGLSINTASNVTGTVLIDDAFVGAVDLKVDTNNISAWQSFTPTGTWNTNVTYSGRWRRVGDTAEIEYRALTSGAPNSANFALDVPSFIGVVDTSKMISDPLGFSNLGSRVDVLKSGGNRYQGHAYYDASLSRVFAYTIKTFSGTNPVYNGIEGVTSTVPVTFANGDSVIVKVSLPIVGWASSGSIYSSTNADTDWQACNFSTLAWQGLGTVTSSLLCKRQGSDILINGRVTIGTTAAAVARIPLPTWNGTQLASSSKITGATSFGRLLRSNNGTSTFKEFDAFASASQTYLELSVPEYASPTNPLLANNGNALFSGSDVLSIENLRIPIEGWEESNIIIGQFNGLESCTDTYQCTDTYSALVDGSTGLIANPNINGWATSARSATGTYNITYKSGLATVPLNCVATPDNTAAISAAINSSSSTGFQVKTKTTTTGADVDSFFRIICQKQGADFIGKTARAVASDQNVRSVGSVGVDIQSVYFGSSADCSTVCTTGTCTICNQVGSKITSVSFVSTGAYNINGIDGTKYNCLGNGFAPSVAPVSIYHSRQNSTSSLARIITSNTATGALANSANNSITCIGIP